ncbi:MAG: Phosphocarrier protein HPr [Firmicutes bacterium]|nr:Phosphocarrier protein HPr [Bacillota bacterium]MBT9157598.1 Phosphocarrier protein HPr [Bacillota bacterium]
MIEAKVVLTNKLGLHARAAALLTTTAAKFVSTVHLQGNNRTANAKSILMVMALGLTAQSELRIAVDGLDEDECLQALTDLIAHKFYEE